MSCIKRNGFTLTDMVMVIVISCGLLICIFQLLEYLREEARRVDCLNRLGLLGTHSLDYEALNEQLPFYIGPFENQGTQANVQYTFCLVQLLSFYGREDLIEAIDPVATDPEPLTLADAGYPSFLFWINGIDENRPGVAALLSQEAQINDVLCPSDKIADPQYFVRSSSPLGEGIFPFPALLQTPSDTALTNYVANAGSLPVTVPVNNPNLAGAFGPIRNRESDCINGIADGASNVIMFGETLGFVDALPPSTKNLEVRHGMAMGGVALGRPDQITAFDFLFSDGTHSTNAHFGSLHPFVVNFVRCDGSTQSFSRTVDPELFGQLCASADGSSNP